MSDMRGEELLGLLGQDLNAAAVRSFLRALSGRAITTAEQASESLRQLVLHSGVLVVESPIDTRIVALYLQAPDAQTEIGYQGELPYGLQFAWTRKDVVARLQEPDYSGVVGNRNFDAWDAGACMLRVAYGEDDKIKSLAVLPPNPLRKGGRSRRTPRPPRYENNED